MGRWKVRDFLRLLKQVLFFQKTQEYHQETEMTDPTVNGLLLAAITTLAGVVTYLWKQLTDNYKEIKVKADECEEDRQRLWRAMYSIHPACKEIKEL